MLSSTLDIMTGEQLSYWLKRQLVRREWTQADFSRRLDTSPGNVSRWIKGERVPDPASIDKIADVLGVDLDLVLALAGHRPPDTELDPDDPASRIIALVKQVQWTEERAETITATLERFRKFDRQRAEKSAKE